ncbi:substrate-binding periplasmic protein [Litoribrevibacter albus]|uniref:ABC transporter n=1 Tax=Litoribrevibacter albus TaxID=1473156 RepID=A0AA37W773_9GAMM|nr:ABC transporter substrate-binding protein [Litoribrevibacter albus]GLQ31108.1 ABC transporter [Litoribrevibacter albus]
MRVFSAILTLAILLLPNLLKADTIKLTSLEWPPYTSASMKEQGASVAVAKAAFKAMGHELVVEFYPWKRAVHLAKEGQFDGYFPEYYSEELKQDFVLSEPMGSGPLGFAELTSKPISWSTLEDLKKFKVGVVSGYVNTTDFDKMVAEKAIKASEASDDVKNLLKLSTGRTELAVVDQNVLSYLLASDPKLKAQAGKIQFNSTLLEDKQLYVCFKKGARGEKLAGILNEGLKKIDVAAIMKGYLESL